MKYGIIIPICGAAVLLLLTNSILSEEPRAITRTVETVTGRSRAAAKSLTKNTKRHLRSGAEGVSGFLARTCKGRSLRAKRQDRLETALKCLNIALLIALLLILRLHHRARACDPRRGPKYYVLQPGA